MLYSLTNHACVAALFAADAPAPAGPAANPQADLLKMALPLILMFVIFYVLLIRPQQKRQQELTKLQGGLKKGDRVLTQAGIIGTVAGVGETTATLQVDKDVKIEFQRSAIIGLVADKN